MSAGTGVTTLGTGCGAAAGASTAAGAGDHVAVATMGRGTGGAVTIAAFVTSVTGAGWPRAVVLRTRGAF